MFSRVSDKTNKVIYFALCAVFSLAVFFGCIFFDNTATIKITPKSDNLVDQIHFSAEDLTKVGAIYDVNFVLEKDFDENADIFGTPTALLDIKENGRIYLPFFAPDPRQENYQDVKKQLEEVESLFTYDFVALIPPCFSYSEVFEKYLLAEQNGDANNYVTAPVQAKVALSKSEKYFEPTNPSSYITIKVAGDGFFHGFFEPILIGSKGDISQVFYLRFGVVTMLSVLIVMSLAASLVLLVTEGRRTKIYNILLITLGGIYFFTSFLLFLESGSPNFLKLLQICSFNLIAIVAIFKFKKSEKISSKHIFFARAVSIIGLIGLTVTILFDLPIWISRGIYLLLGLMLLLYSFFANDNLLNDLMYCVFGFAMITAGIVPQDYFPLYTVSPSAWLIFFAIVFSLIDIITKFISTTRENKYLIESLTLEVKAQTVDLETTLRDKNIILQYFTHDLKKLACFTQECLEKAQDNLGKESAEVFLDKAFIKNKEVISGFNDVNELIGTKEMKEKFKTVDLCELVKEVFDSLSPDCDSDGVELSLDCKDKLFAVARENELAHIISNLIFNSLEHSKCSKIKLSAFSKGSLCYITVSDNGRGIPDDIDVYSPNKSTRTGNSGIGLTLAKDKIEQMGGEISFESSSLGTTFSVVLKKRKRKN